MDNFQNYKQQWFDFVEYNPHPGQLQLHNPPMGDYVIAVVQGGGYSQQNRTTVAYNLESYPQVVNILFDMTYNNL